jgi:hypothetical protein
MYDPSKNWGEMFIWAGKAGDSRMQGAFTENITGRFEMQLESGTYTFGFSRKFGLGPIILPKVVVADGKTTPVALFYSDPYCVHGTEKIDGYREYAQGFVGRGEYVRFVKVDVVDLPKDARLVFSFREGSPTGKQIGRESIDGYFKFGEVRLEKGKTYFLCVRRNDNQPFSVMKAPPIEGCPAYGDGRLLASSAIAGKIVADRIGITVSAFPEHGLLNGRACKSTMGQSFVARGTSLAMIDFIPAIGDGRRTQTVYTVRIRENGPGGKQIGPVKQSVGSDLMAGFHLGFQLRTILYSPGEVPLVPGNKYYIEISGESGGFQVSVNDSNMLEGEFFIDGELVPGKAIDMVIVEYTPDDCPPPSAINVTAEVVGTAVQIGFDVPENMDVNSAIISRTCGNKTEELASFYVCPGQTVVYTDRTVKLGNRYKYSVAIVDCAGNKSDVVTSEVVVGPLTKNGNLLINSNFIARGSVEGVCPGWNTANISMGAVWSVVKDKDGQCRLQAWNRGHPYDVVAYQQVPVVRGKTYVLKVLTNRWDPFNNGRVNNISLLGIDPLGRDNPLADSVIWSAPEYVNDKWVEQSVKATAQSDAITVYLRARAIYGPWDPGMTIAFSRAILKIVDD